MTPKIPAKSKKPLFDPAAFYKSFYDETVVQKRKAELESLKMDEIQSQRGWYGYEMPDSRWSDHWKNTITVSNYRSWPAEARGWIVQVKNGGDYVCMLRRKAVYEMPEKEWDELMEKARHLKEDYPMLDEMDHSNVEQEYQDREWRETYREEFQRAMHEKFDEVFLTMNHGEEKEAKFQEMLADDKLTDRFFYDYMQDRWDGDEWREEQDGDMHIDVDEIVKGIDTSDISDYLWPEDPRQMQFKFMRQAESIVRKMLDDDLMVMIESPLAHRIVDELLEDAGPHKYSCVMINLPEELGEQIMAWGRLQIKDEDVFVDEKGGMGREDEPHVTVLYGLLDEKPSDVLLQVFEHTAPFDIKLGPCSLFKKPEYDVIKMEVISPFLHALNSNVRSVVAYENDYPDYKPHVTIAYVKPGTADRLEGASPWDDPVQMGVTKLGQEGQFTARAVIFSSSNGQKTEYDLGTSEKTAKAVNEASDCWEAQAFESFMGRKPEADGELQKWIREASQAFYRETGNIKGLQGWLQSLTESDSDLDAFVRDSGAADVPAKMSHATIRRLMGKVLVDRVDIWKIPRGNWNIHDPNRGDLPREAKIQIVYRQGNDRKVWNDSWCSYSVLKWALRNWRNLYGAPLFVDGEPAGKVDYRNPALAE